MGLIKPDTVINDYSSAVDWQAAIDAGNVFIAKMVKVDIPEPAVKDGESLIGGGPDQTIDGQTHTINIQDGNVIQANSDFWSTVNGRPYKIAVREVKEERIRVYDFNMIVKATSQTLPGSASEKQRYVVSIVGDSEPSEFPSVHDEPTGIFDA